MGKSAQITASCGIGDIVSFFAKIPSFKKTHQIDYLHIHLSGGWIEIPKLIIELSQPVIKSGLISSISLEEMKVDYKESWIPDDSTLKYQFSIPFSIPTFPSDDIKIPFNKICAINPVTASGNFEGFTPGRYLSKEVWIEICKFMQQNGYRIVYLGGEKDCGYIPLDYIDLDLCGVTTIRECISVLNKSDFFIGCNSWMWECCAYRGIPTVCSYLTNYDIFCKIHVPSMERPSHGIPNLRISTNQSTEEILKYMEELYER